MTMEDKEIKFWLKHPEWDIPFIDECDMDWDSIKNDYFKRVEREKQLGIDKIRENFYNALSKLSSEEIDAFTEEGILPDSLSKIIQIDPVTSNFVSKEYPDIVIGTIYDILERDGDRFTSFDIMEIDS